MASPVLITTSTSTSGYTANEKRTRTPFEFTTANCFLRTKFPGHRPRYIQYSICEGNAYKLYRACVDTWPEYFSASAPHPFQGIRGSKHSKGLFTIGFVGEFRKGETYMVKTSMCDDLAVRLLQSCMRCKAAEHAEKMWKTHRISVSSPTVWDIHLVREGRDELEEYGIAFNRLRQDKSNCRVIGEEEKREARKRRKNDEDEDEEEEERARQRQRS